MAAAAPSQPTTPTTARPTNSVTLIGRIAIQATERTLASGDIIVTSRVIVARELDDSRSSQRVDTLDLVGWSPRVQRSMRAWEAGQQVEIEGAIRRRFFRGPAGPVSRVEVEVRRAKRLKG